MMDNTGNRRELVSTSISPHSQKVSDRSAMTFYQNGKLTTEISAQGYCHVSGAQATHMAQFDQTQEPNFLESMKPIQSLACGVTQCRTPPMAI